MDEYKARPLVTSNDEIDLRVILRLLMKNYKLILGTAFSFALVGALVSLFVLNPVYESSAVIMPTREQNVSGRLGNMLGSSGLSQILNLGGASQEITQYYEILQSQALVSSVIRDRNFIEEFNVQIDESLPQADARAHYSLSGRLRKNVEVLMEGSILRLRYRNEDPLLAFEVIDAYLEKLAEFVQTNMTTSAQSTQQFVEARLNEAENNLETAEAQYLALQNAKGVVELPSQLGLSLSTASNLRSRLIEKEMEIELYRNILKDSSEIQRLESEKAQIQAQLDQLISGRSEKKGAKKKMEVFTPLGEGAALSFQFANAERTYLMQVKLVELLHQQLELARIETKKQEPMFQVIDPPLVPVLPAGPNKKLITILSFMLGGFISCIAVLFAGNIDNLPSRVYRIVKVDVQEKKKHQIHPKA